MPIRKDVNEVLDMLRSLGLEPVMESGRGHYKVRDPRTGVFLFGVSSSPSDPNWRWMIMRHLRRLGLLRKGEYKKYKKGGNIRRGKPAIDLVALKKAQDAAAAAGQRIPTLDDLEDSTEFFTRIKEASNVTHYSPEAQEEAIEIMAATADAPRVNYVIQRLRKLFDEKSDELEALGRERQIAKMGHARGLGGGRGSRAEFVRIAIEDVAPKRKLRAWKTESSGQQTLHSILDKDQKGLSVWVLTLLEATMDHIDGLKWGEIDESRIAPPPETQFAPKSPFPQPPLESEEKGLLPDKEIPGKPADIEVEEIPARPWPALFTPAVELVSDDQIKEKYAEILLEHLRNSSPDKLPKEVLERLDRMVGLA